MKLNRLAVALLELRTDPPPSLLMVFGCGLLIVGILVNYLYDLLVGFSDNLLRTLSAPAVLVLLLAAARYAYGRFERSLEAKMRISERSNVPPARFVITALSPLQELPSGGDNLENIRRLIQHHSPRLQELHIISVLDIQDGNLISVNPQLKDSQGVIKAYQSLSEWIEKELDNQVLMPLHPIVDPNSAQDCFNAVSKLLLTLKANSEISPEDVVVDVTAGTKPMTVGMSAAAFINGYPLSYQATKRDAEGKPDFTANTRDTSMVYLTLDQQFRTQD